MILRKSDIVRGAKRRRRGQQVAGAAHEESAPTRRGPSASRAHGGSGILFLLFFGSGVSGLIYEIVWTRMLTLVFGNTVFATATVLTAFMAGLALGSFWAGRFVDRLGHPLRLYGWLELIIGFSALGLPLLFDQFFPLYRWVYHEFEASPYVVGLMQFGASSLLLLIPTSLMGATLPVLSRYCSGLNRQFGRQVGLLYGLNTLGAALGCLLAGFVLIGAIGVRESNWTAVALNLLIGSIALHVSGRQGNAPLRARASQGRPAPNFVDVAQDIHSPVGQWVPLVVFGLSGFASLAYEVLWTRALVFFIDVDIYAFTALLTTFLLGIGLGSVLMSGIDHRRSDPVAIFAWLELGIGAFALLSIPILANLYVVGISQVSTWWMLPGVKMLNAFLVMGIPTLLMGATFPVVTRIYTTNLAQGGRSVGTLYAVNTVGAIIGAFAGGFVLLPLAGLQRSLLLVAAVNLGAAAMLWLLAHRADRRPRLVRATLACLLWVFAAYLLPPHMLYQLFRPAGRPEFSSLVRVEEGITTTVTIHQNPADGTRLLATNRKEVAGTDSSFQTIQKLVAHLPLLVHPNPRRVLHVGFGSGQSAWEISLHPSVERLDSVEISPEVVEAAHDFAEVNHNVFRDPRLRLFVMDGKNFLRMKDERYDVILNNSFVPTISGNANLYTREYFESGKRRLNPDGVMSSCVLLHLLSPEHLQMIVRTFQEVFPFTSIWYKTNEIPFVLLIGSNNPEFAIDVRPLRDRLRLRPIRRSLDAIAMGGSSEVVSAFVMGPGAARRYAGQGRGHSDNYPSLEFSSPKTVPGVDSLVKNLTGLLQYREPVASYLTGVASDDRRILEQYYESRTYTLRAYLALVQGHLGEARREITQALMVNPGDQEARSLLEFLPAAPAR